MQRKPPKQESVKIASHKVSSRENPYITPTLPHKRHEEGHDVMELVKNVNVRASLVNTQKRIWGEAS